MTRTIPRALAAALVAAMLLTGTAAAAAPTADDPLPSAPDQTVQPLIVGGHPASQVYRGVGSIQYERNGNPDWHTCAAVLWTPWWASTNAHCVTHADSTPKDPLIYKLRFNTNKRIEGGVLTGVRTITVYPAWDWSAPGGLEGDMVMLRLTQPVFGVPTVLPPLLRPWPVQPGPARIIGWGWTYMPWDQPDQPTDLSELDTNIVDPSYCKAANIDVGEVCVMADNPAATACGGDSGGPVMTRSPIRNTWYAIGTASRETAPDCTGAVVYTNLMFYRDWAIKVITGKYKAPKQSRPAPKDPRPAYRWAGCDTTC